MFSHVITLSHGVRIGGFVGRAGGEERLEYEFTSLVYV